jgi:hypothetical protein
MEPSVAAGGFFFISTSETLNVKRDKDKKIHPSLLEREGWQFVKLAVE